MAQRPSYRCLEGTSRRRVCNPVPLGQLSISFLPRVALPCGNRVYDTVWGEVIRDRLAAGTCQCESLS